MLSVTTIPVKIIARLILASCPMFLLYDDEDQILPLLLHRVEEGHPKCSCRDCVGIIARMRQLNLDVDHLSPPLVA